MKILKIEPCEKPEIVETGDISLEWLQEQVGGLIEAVYPFMDDVALICDEEGKLKSKALNRVLRDEDNEVYDILVGTVLVVGLGEEDFTGLSDEFLEKYEALYHEPEYIFFDEHNRVQVVPYSIGKSLEEFVWDMFCKEEGYDT